MIKKQGTEKSETDTSLADFRRRFPTTDDLVDYLLAPPNRRVTAAQFWEESQNNKALAVKPESVAEKP